MKKTLPRHIRRLILCAILPFPLTTGCRTLEPATPAPPPEPSPRETVATPDPLSSILTVSVTAQSAMFLQPWNKAPAQRRRGLGALLPNNRILVTAMLVADANFVDLQRPPQGRRVPARVIARDYACNLALLEPLEDPEGFLAGMTPLELDEPAHAEDKVAAWQVADDGSPLIAEGKISRIDIGAYPPGNRGLLTYRFQGSVEPQGGTSLIPAIRKNKLTGILLVSDDQNEPSAILPAPIIRLFLEDVEAGTPRAFPVLGIQSERTTDGALRRYLELADDAGGVFVSRVIPESPASQAGLQEGDVILSLDGYRLDQRKFYRDPHYGMLDFSHLISGRKRAGEIIHAEIWRKGQTLSMEFHLSRKDAKDEFVPPFLFDTEPGYVVFGGLVFTELSRPYLQFFREERNAPILLRYIHAYPHKFSEGRKSMVLLAYMIPTPVNVGYEQIGQTPVEEVNGKTIRCLIDLREALQTPRNGLHAIRVQGPWPTIYLDAALTAQVNQRLLASGISPLQRTP